MTRKLRNASFQGMLQASLSLFKTCHSYLPFSFQNQWLVFWEISHATSPVSYADFPLYCQISISHTPSTTVFLQTPLCFIILYGKDFMYNRPIIRCGCILNTTTFATNKQWHNQYLFPFNIGLNSLYFCFCSICQSKSMSRCLASPKIDSIISFTVIEKSNIPSYLTGSVEME